MTGPSAYPPVIRRYWYTIDWEVEALWALDLPVVSLPMARLAWHLGVPVWPDATGRPYCVTPREVLAAPDVHKAEHCRILHADPAFPIEVIDRDGRLMILDGVHRLAKLWSGGAGQVTARMIPAEAVRRLAN